MSDATLEEIANGSLLPNVEVLSIANADPEQLISALQARQRSVQHSTITETGVDPYFIYGRLSMHNIDCLVELMMSGFFLFHPRITRDSDESRRGQIEKYAHLDFEMGSGVFEPPSDTESVVESL
ncbi:hypothetical protein C8R44DRAFT_886435 [Mycena epipterygia]|nr:hypothetical protein C8R44DRAFT_886435 [Mycena epipterygia]